MMKRLIHSIASVVSLLVLLASCGHDSPPERLVPDTNGGAVAPPTGGGGGGDGHRPGASTDGNLARELADDVWRITGPGVELRYDRGGVLFDVQSNGSTEVVDLDGAACAGVTLGAIGADSIVTGAGLMIDGRDAGVQRVKMLRRGDGRTWYEATGGADKRWIIVLPE